MTTGRPLSIGHSPDADDAFMFYALAKEAVTIPGYEIQHVMEDIETLNRRSETGDLDVTAVSAAHYPAIADKYRIMSCGASIGRNYGPALVTTKPVEREELAGKRIGIPGEYTTSWLLFRIFFEPEVKPVFLDFDAITPAVLDGSVDAGILLHEGQILYERQGLHRVMDLGQEWFSATGLPIPLGLDLIHRRLGDDGQLVAKALYDSIVYAMEHEDDALDYAMTFGRGIDREDGRRFVRMYVNEDTVDMGEDGRKALETLYGMAEERGLIARAPVIDMIQANQ
ncbi:MAG: ABC transporter substrate-binding protein [Chloroflexi bacterium]|nr:ABC transporter substrate-binding protein [Chloroflexota bacterium]MCH8102799.1 ABC transporter substrate-binding protein [Chloroflexota bacterium]